MKKMSSIMYYTGLTISALIGFLHFFAPQAFSWYSYIPDAPKEIIAAVKYVNFFTSFLLFGLSTILIFFKKKVFAGSIEAFVFYVFLVLTWFCRVIITLAVPWPSHLQTWLLPGFSAEFILTLLPAVYLLWSNANHYRKNQQGIIS